METIKQTLDDLEQMLKEIKSREPQPCDSNYNKNINNLFMGAYHLQSMHRIAGELAGRVIDLHSRYLNVCFELYGFYPGQDCYK